MIQRGINRVLAARPAGYARFAGFVRPGYIAALLSIALILPVALSVLVWRAATLQSAGEGRVLWVAVVAATILLVAALAWAVRYYGKRLRRADGELATTLRSVADAVIATDTAGSIRFMNGVAEQLTGWDEKSARGRPLDEVFRVLDEETRATVESLVTRILREGKIVGLTNHTVLIARGGQQYSIDNSGAPIFDENELIGVVLVFRDVTAQRAAARALLESEQRFRAAIDAVQGVLWTNNAVGEMTGEQPGWAALTGQSAAAYQGLGWADAVHPDDARPTLEAWFIAVRERRMFVFEHRVKRHDGEWRHCSIRAIPLLDAHGSIREWVGVHTDITEQRRSEERVRQRERQFVGLANAMPQIVWTERPDGLHEYFNGGWYAYTGLTEDESRRGDAWARVLHPEDQARTSARWERSRVSAEPYEMQFRLRRHDGAFRWFLARAVADRDAHGRVVQWFGTCTDIDGTKRTEENLRSTEMALREADFKKDVFLATLSHELRNPLAPIRNAARLLENPNLSPQEMERGRQIIARQVRLMASLLDDLLDMSRITRGVFALKKRYGDLRAMLAEALETAKPLIDAKQHAISCEWPSEAVEVEADPVRLVQVITNLLTNAAKYTNPEGHIVFRAFIENDVLIISVRDDGIGIAADMLAKVFDMFSQADPGQERGEGGLGIGLALVKGLVELHGGRIEAHSAGLDHGSEFVVFLPCLHGPGGRFAQLPQDDAQAAKAIAPRCILIADDNVDGAESMAMLLQLSGNEIFIAHTGTQALSLATLHRPHVAILDIGMPGMNGYEVAQRIRREAWGLEITLIAVTGWGQEDDKRRAQNAGFDHHLTKPVDVAALEKLLGSSHEHGS